MEDQSQFGLAEVLEKFKRRKWLSIFTFLMILGPVLSILLALPNRYQATATLVVERQQLPESLVKSTVMSGLDSRMQSISQEIFSRARLEELINRFGLYENLRKEESLDELIEQMRKDIKIEPVVSTGEKSKKNRDSTAAFTVSYTNGDSHKAATLANTIASLFVEENLKARGQQAAATAQFVEAQLTELKNKLTEQEQKVGRFREQYLGELPEQMTENLATLAKLHEQERLNEDKQALANEKREFIERQLQSVNAPTFVESSNPAEASLGTLRRELAMLRTQYSDKHPEVLRLQAKLAELEKLTLNTDGTSNTDGTASPQQKIIPANSEMSHLREELDKTTTDSATLQRGAENLRQSMVTYQQRVENTPRRDLELRELSRDYEATKEAYQLLLARQEEARIAESMEQRQKGENLRVVDPAVAPEEPVAPKRVLFIVLGVFAALGAALGIVFVVELFDDSFHTPEALREFSTLPVLISVPRIITIVEARRKRLRFYLTGVAVGAFLLLVCSSLYFFADQNESLVMLLFSRGG